jgi:hypothetical protein
MYHDYLEKKEGLIFFQATYPFASPEILSGKSLKFEAEGDTSEDDDFDDSKPASTTHQSDIQVRHDAKHDIEAFFWVLTYICLTRKGPNGERRDELKTGSDDSPYARQVRRSYYAIFGSENAQDLIRNKTNLFFSKGDYRRFVVQNFHPYFYPLRELMVRWWKLLRLAHQEPVFETLHDWTLYLLDQCILELGEEKEAASAAIVDRERANDLKSLQIFGSEGSKSQHTAQDIRSAEVKAPNIDVCKAQHPWDMSPDAGQLGTPGMSYRGEPIPEPESPTPTQRPIKECVVVCLVI